MEIIKYKDIDVKIDYENKNVWLTKDEMSKLFNLSRPRIHAIIKEIYENYSYSTCSTCLLYEQVQIEGERKIRRNV